MKNPLKFSLPEQLLMGLIALGGLILLLLLTSIYMAITADFSVLNMSNKVFKTLIVINAMFGVMFLGSTFIGLYQQYNMAKMANDLQGLSDIFNLKGGNEHAEKGL